MTIVGTVLASHEAEALPLDHGELTVRDDAGDAWDTAAIGADGTFTVAAPAGVRIYADVGAPDLLTASFTATSGLSDFAAETGTLYAFDEGELAVWTDDFAGCPGADQGGLADGGALVGEVRFDDLVDDDGQNTIVTNAVVSWIPASGPEQGACYLDLEGLAYDPAAAYTGDSGRFAVFGATPGLGTLKVGFQVYEGSWSFVSYDTRVPEGGVVPRFPAWLEFL